MRKITIGVVSLLAVLILAGNLLAFGGNTGMTSNFWKMSSGDLVPTASNEKIKVYDLEVTNAFTLGGTVGTGGIDMNGEVITNIGNAGTDFGSSGELTLASSLTVGSDILSDTAATDSIGSEAVYWLKGYFGSELSFEGSTDNDFQTTISFTDPTTPDKTITFQDASGIVAMDATAVTDLEGTALSITTGTLNVTEADPLSALKALSNLASVAINESLISDTAATDNLGSEALYWLKGFFGSELSFEGATDNDYQTTLSFTDTTTADKTITFQDADGIVVMDSTAVTDLEGTKLSITTGTLNVTETDPLSATMALNNLASVAINTSLISDTADTDSLGSATKEWLNAYLGDNGKLYFGIGQDATIHRSASNVLTLTASSGVIASAGITLEGGVMGIKETTTPSAVTDYGKIYTKSDNVLYFQDGAGAEHSVSFTDTNFAEMYLLSNTTATVIDTADAWHAVSLSEMTVGEEDGWIYADGVTGSDITTMATYDSGASTLITTTAAHNLSDGDFITITGTTNYNNPYEVLSAPSGTTFEIDKAWNSEHADNTGTYNRGGTLTAGTGTAGIYSISWDVTITPETNAHIFTASYIINKTPCTKCRARLKLGTAGDFGNMGSSGVKEFSVGDKIQFIIRNVGATGNVTIRHGNLNLHRL